MARLRLWTIYGTEPASYHFEVDAIIDDVRWLLSKERFTGIPSANIIVRDPESKDRIDEEAAVADILSRGWGSKKDRALVITITSPPEPASRGDERSTDLGSVKYMIEIQTNAIERQTSAIRFQTVAFKAFFKDRVAWTSNKTERMDNRPFKKRLYNFYECRSDYPTNDSDLKPYPDTLRCCLLNQELGAPAVIGAHLFKREFGSFVEMMCIDIDGPRNGLLLYKPIEEAFDRGQLCFVSNKQGQLLCHILDPSLLAKGWKESLKLKGSDRAPPQGTQIEIIKQAADELDGMGLKTFQVLEGRPLHLRFMDRKPYRRVLNLHARFCRERAIEHGWLSKDGWDFEDYWSDFQYRENVAGLTNPAIEQWLAQVMEGSEPLASEAASV